MVERADDSVVQRGPAAGIDAFQSFFQFRDAVAEILVEIQVEIIVEVHDESFVAGIAALHQGNGRFIHAGTFFAHAAAIVDHQAHADGNIFAFENGELLFDLIFKDAKIFLLEAFGETSAIVEYRSVQDHQVDADGNGATLIGTLAWRWRRWWRKGILRESDGRDGGHQNTARRRYEKRPPPRPDPGKQKAATTKAISGWVRSSRFCCKP